MVLQMGVLLVLAGTCNGIADGCTSGIGRNL